MRNTKFPLRKTRREFIQRKLTIRLYHIQGGFVKPERRIFYELLAFNETVGVISEKLTAFFGIVAALADDEKHVTITGYSTLNYLSETVSNGTNTNNN